MQIYELNTLREGLLDRVKDIAKTAVSPAHQAQQQQAKTTQQGVASLGRLQAQGYGQRAAPQASATLNQVKSNPQMQQYARTLAQQWMQKSASLSITPSQAPAKSSLPKPGAKPLPAAAAAPQTVSVGGQKLNPRNPQDARVLAALKAQGKISEAFANLPGGSQAVPAPQQYLAKFREWAGKTLTTRDPTTYQTITLDQVEKDPVIGRQLKQAQGQVVASRDNPARLEQAVAEYVTVALAGVQQIIIANKTKTSTTPAPGTNRVIKSTGDTAADNYLKRLGYTVS